MPPFDIIPDDELPECDPDAHLGATPDDYGSKNKNIKLIKNLKIQIMFFHQNLKFWCQKHNFHLFFYKFYFVSKPILLQP